MEGRLEAAIATYRRAVEIVESAGLTYFPYWIAANFGETLLAAGQLEEARRTLDFAVAATAGGPLHRLSPRAAIALGRVQFLLGDTSTARATLEDVARQAAGFGQSAVRIAALRQLALVADAAAPEEAAALNREAVEMEAPSPPDPLVAATRRKLIVDELCLPI
jgi:tetratricopeptide (TPR) repeat protein